MRVRGKAAESRRPATSAGRATPEGDNIDEAGLKALIRA